MTTRDKTSAADILTDPIVAAVRRITATSIAAVGPDDATRPVPPRDTDDASTPDEKPAPGAST